MGLEIFALIVIIEVVLIILVAVGIIPFGPAMIIFGIFFLVFLVCLFVFIPTGLLLKGFGIVFGVGIVLVLIAYYGSSGATSLIWWMGGDDSRVEPEEKRTCPWCGAENKLGRRFCVRCGKSLFPGQKREEDLKIATAKDKKEERGDDASQS